MTIKTLTIKVALIAGLLATVVSPVLAPTANAGLFDWFRGNVGIGQTSTGTSNGSYLNAGNILGSTDVKQESAALISDTFLLAINQPDKNSLKNTNTAKKVTNVAITARELVVSITAYSSTPDQTDDSPFITANGTYVYDGLVAANFLPFHAKIQIPDYFGDKIFTVEDRMNRRFQNRVDVWFPDRQSALEFGHRVLKIKILES